MLEEIKKLVLDNCEASDGPMSDMKEVALSIKDEIIITSSAKPYPLSNQQ